MKRIGRVSRLKPGAATQYERIHEAVWPEVVEAIRRAGIANYSIFRHGEWLFSYLEVPENRPIEDVWKKLDDSPECRRWEALMEPLRREDEAGAWQPMKEVWHLEEIP